MSRPGSVRVCLRLGCFLGFFAFVLAQSAGAEEVKRAAAIGSKVTNLSSLRDLRGNRRALHSFAGHKAVVLVFLGTECPISNLYLPGLVDLEKRYRSKQVQFLAVYPNELEDLDKVGMHAYDRKIPFPVLKDSGQQLADGLGVTRVPTAVLLDGDFVLRYRGRVDDRYAHALSAAAPEPGPAPRQQEDG